MAQQDNVICLRRIKCQWCGRHIRGNTAHFCSPVCAAAWLEFNEGGGKWDE
jgi:hypothetical protein